MRLPQGVTEVAKIAVDEEILAQVKTTVKTLKNQIELLEVLLERLTRNEKTFVC
jgi:ubiquinone biosynthesis protein UbiJ